MDQILEIVKSDKVLKQVVERVNQENQVDVAALNHDIAINNNNLMKLALNLKSNSNHRKQSRLNICTQTNHSSI